MSRILILVLCSLVLAPAAVAQLSLADRLKPMAFAGEAETARTYLESERDKQNLDSADWLLAVSWVARGLSFIEEWDSAERYAQEAYDGSAKLVEQGAEIDEDKALELALGAAIEVLGQARAAQGDLPGAISFLASERERYRETAVETRIQKNYLLVGLEGKPMPALEADQFIGEATSIDADGKPALFFFWAHWCPDCKDQKPALIELREKYGDELAIVAPTRLYGYAGRRANLTPEEEVAYIEGQWQQQYGLPEWMPKPLSQQNFVDFGVSTTPTLVLVDRQGVVRLYHPGQLSFEELDAAIQPLL